MKSYEKTFRLLSLTVFILSIFSIPKTANAYRIIDNEILIIEEGDNLWNIARDLYGSGFVAFDLWGRRIDNSMGNPHLIEPGMKFRLIKKKEVSNSSDSLSVNFSQLEKYLKSYETKLDSLIDATNKITKAGDGKPERTGDSKKGFWDYMFDIFASIVVTLIGGLLLKLVMRWTGLEDRDKTDVFFYLFLVLIFLVSLIAFSDFFKFDGWIDVPKGDSDSEVGNSFIPSANAIITLCASFIVAIMGIALPILIRTISEFQEKYDSKLIIEFFEESNSNQKFNQYLRFGLLILVGVAIVT